MKNKTNYNEDIDNKIDNTRKKIKRYRKAQLALLNTATVAAIVSLLFVGKYAYNQSQLYNFNKDNNLTTHKEIELLKDNNNCLGGALIGSIATAQLVISKNLLETPVKNKTDYLNTLQKQKGKED